MGLTSTSLKFVLRKSKKYRFTGPVLTFGNQDIYATENDIKKWAKEEDIALRVPKKILYSTSKDVQQINKQTQSCIHAITFFEFIGISEKQYYDIDKFPFDKPKIIHDLQLPIDKKFHNFFNLIIDSGTLEHIFDVKSVMENIVRITKVGGYVLQFIPAQNFLNHGFYQFSPTFFYDFYLSNGFDVIESYIIEIGGVSDRFHTYDQKKDYIGLFFKPGSRLVNCFLVQKKKVLKQIALPDQYYYKKLAENSKKVKKDFNRSFLDKIISLGRGALPVKYHGIFFEFWFFLKRLTSRREYFDIHK